MKTQKGGRGIGLPYSTPAMEREGWSAPHPGHSNPGEENRYTLHRGWVGLGAGLDGYAISPSPSSP